MLLPLFAVLSSVSLALVALMSGRRELAWKLFATFGMLLSAPPLLMLISRFTPAPYHVYVARLIPAFALATFAAAMMYVGVIGRLKVEGQIFGRRYLADFSQDPPVIAPFGRSKPFRQYLTIVFGFWALVGLLLVSTDWAIRSLTFSPEGAPLIEFGPAAYVAMVLMVMATIKIVFFLKRAHQQASSRHLRSFLKYNMAAFGVLFIPAVTLNLILPALGLTRVPLGLMTVPLAAFVFLAGIVRYQFAHIEELNENLESKVRERTRQLEQAQLRLVQSEKMASTAQVVAGLAHELNNPVGAIRSMVDNAGKATKRLRGQTEDPNRALEVLENAHRVIGDGASRVAELVSRLRSFSHLDEAEVQEHSLQLGLEEVLGFLKVQLHDAQIELELAELPPVLCRPNQLNQLWLNLLMNAAAAISKGGTIRVRSGGDASEQWVEIADDGKGIHPKLLERIFDPDFTTKGERIGSGLGLAICYQIVEDHQGSIQIDSELGSGTRVKVVLPTRPSSLLSPVSHVTDAAQ